MTQKQYSRLNSEDREAISRGLTASLSFAEIARQIGRPGVLASAIESSEASLVRLSNAPPPPPTLI